MIRIIIIVIIILFSGSCKIKTEDISENKCNSKENIVKWYLADVSKIVEFYLDENTDKEFPINSYYHLEILSSNTHNIDSLDILLLEYGIPITYKFKYFKKWINWLETHSCYSLTKANEIFKIINEKYGFDEMKMRDDQLKKARKKYPQGTYSKIVLDSIIRSVFTKRNIRSRLGWYNH